MLDEYLEKIKELEVKISGLEDELLQEKIKNNDLEDRLKKAKEMLPAWQSMQL